MSTLFTSKDIGSGERVRHGWIRSIRRSKKITFVAATDGKDEYQLTLKHKGSPDDAQIDGELKIGASFQAVGTDSTTPRGSYEFLTSKFVIVGDADDDFPIQPKEHSSEFLRSIPETRGRTAATQAVWRIRHLLSMRIHEILTKRDFIQYYAPLITSADCEGAGETFKVSSDWMDSHLTVSAQLHGEVGMMSCGKIYTFGPCFRAEKSTGRRHLSEFWMVEPEMVFHDLEETMDLAEDLIRESLTAVLTLGQAELEKLRIDYKHLEKVLFTKGEDWHRITYDQAIDELGKSWGEDLSAEGERKLVELFGGPVFVTHWPKQMKPFYMKTEDLYAECFDLIFPDVGELVGGSVREESYDKLKTAMVETGVDLESMDWYLQTRKWGTVPHAGFGLGIERLVMFACQLEKVHDAVPFPVHF